MSMRIFFSSFIHLNYIFILFLHNGKYELYFIVRKNMFLFVEEVMGFSYIKSMLSTCIWSEAKAMELPSRKKIKLKTDTS